MTATTNAAIAEFAAAKVNLYLHVTGRREDGYHLLDSLVVFAGVGDDLRFEPSDRLSLTIQGPNGKFLTADEDNIVLKAAHGLARALSRPAQAAITLEKHLPVAAGIGGGSADAAATLRGLLKLWRAEIEPARLFELALSLGADLPVCLAGKPTQMAGVGEQLRPSVALPSAALVLVNPRVALSTPSVFKARTAEFSPAAPLMESPKNAADLAKRLRRRQNDLAAPAELLEPTIGAMIERIAATDHCLLARMSGSGATCFGLYDDLETAEKAARQLHAQHPEWWVAAADILS